MTTYEFYRQQGKSDRWLRGNIQNLCGDCDMIRKPAADKKSTAYQVGAFVLHVRQGAVDTIEAQDKKGKAYESWTLDI